MLSQGLYVAVLLSVLSGSAPAAVTQLINSDGKLMGALGVVVEARGTYLGTYDVIFADGTCAGVFGSCASSALAFNDPFHALAAANALLDSVLVDTAQVTVDSDPTLQVGISRPAPYSQTFIPYGTAGSDVYTAMARNYGGTDTDDSTNVAFDATFDTSINLMRTWAKFSLVPLPAAGWFLASALALGGLGLRRRRTH